MYKKVEAAAQRLKGVAHRTPVVHSRLLNEATGNEIFLKCENLQRMGAFKFRGAYNAVSALTPEERARGVITYSSGNHAQAVALTANLYGIKAVVIVPTDAPFVKVAAAEAYGATLIPYDRMVADRETVAAEYIREHGYTLIPPYNHEEVVAGQGTAAKEMIEDVGGLDIVLAPCGGGGLLSGTAISSKSLLPQCRVIGVEPELADDATRSFKSGVIHSVSNPMTIADGLRTPSLGSVTFPLVRKYVDDMVTVSEQAIVSATHYVWTRMKLVIEPSGAVALAPLISGKINVSGKRIGIIISGGNADMQQVASLFAQM